MERMKRLPLKRLAQEPTNFQQDDYEPVDIEVSPPKRNIQVITEIPIEFESCGEDLSFNNDKRDTFDKNDEDSDDYDDPNDKDWKGSSSQSIKAKMAQLGTVILKKPITPIVNRKSYQSRAARLMRHTPPETNSKEPQTDPLAAETPKVVDLRRVGDNTIKKPPINRFPCGYCDTVFTDSSFLGRHHKRCKAKRAHDSAKSPGPSQPQAPTPPINITEQQSNRNTAQSRRKSYNCPQCSFSTKNPEHLKYHTPKHANDKPFSCNECNYTCRESDFLDMHKKMTHSESKDPPVPENETADSNDNESDTVSVDQIKIDPSLLFSCDQCSYTSIRSGYLNMHKRIHSRGEPLVCDDCGYKCSRISYFKKHRLTHAGEIPILCDTCDFSCTRLGRMEAHKLTHVTQELSIEYSPDD